jgi:hypothetical protein
MDLFLKNHLSLDVKRDIARTFWGMQGSDGEIKQIVDNLSTYFTWYEKICRTSKETEINVA